MHCLSSVFLKYRLQTYSSSQPTREDRGWVIDPFGSNPWWSLLLAIVPALLASILVFMDQQITAIIVNRKENKLKVIVVHKTTIQRHLDKRRL